MSPATATRKVTFYSRTAILGTESLVNGTAVLTSTLLSSGVDHIKAYYAGNSNDSASSSAILIETVTAGAANGFLVPVTYAAGIGSVSVAPGDFNGDGKLDLAAANYESSSVSVLLGNGDGTFQPPISTPTASTLLNVAVGGFNGDGKADLVVSAVLTQTVLKAPTATRLTDSPNPSTFGQSVTLTAIVVPLTAAGTVTFKDGSTVLGSGVLNHGKATFSTTTLSSGSHSLKAVYGGDANDDPDASAPVVQVVQ